jgi:hypothetical protein
MVLKQWGLGLNDMVLQHLQYNINLRLYHVISEDQEPDPCLNRIKKSGSDRISDK